MSEEIDDNIDLNYFEGWYIYSGDGQWQRIKNSLDKEHPMLRTDTLHYESVPRQIREKGYDLFERADKEHVLVRPDQS